MHTAINTLYLYNIIHRVLFVDDHLLCYDKDISPVNRKAVKVHKGIDNQLLFRALDPNNLPVDLCMYDVYGRLFDYESHEQILERLCILKERSGVFSLNLNSGDVADVSPGLYQLVFVLKDANTHSAVENTGVMFTDYDSNVVLTVEITDQAQRVPEPSYTIEPINWTFARQGTPDLSYPDRYISSAIPANRTTHYIEGVHSYSVSATSFTGKLFVYGTLYDTPDPSEKNWFTVSTMGQDEQFLDLRNFTGTECFTFKGNYMWLRFVYMPDPENEGTLDKIITRF